MKTPTRRFRAIVTRACCPIVTKDEHAGSCRRLPVVRIRLLPLPIPVLKHTDFRTCRNFLPAPICRPKYGGRTEICASGRKFLAPGPTGLGREGYGMPRRKRSLPITRYLSRSAISQARHPVYTAGWAQSDSIKTNCLGWRARLRTILLALASDQARWRWWCCNDRFLNVTICKSIMLKHCFPCGRCDRIFIGRPRRETQAHRRKTPGKRICNNGRMGNRKIPFLAWRLVRPDAAARSRRGPDAASI